MKGVETDLIIVVGPWGQVGESQDNGHFIFFDEVAKFTNDPLQKKKIIVAQILGSEAKRVALYVTEFERESQLSLAGLLKRAIPGIKVILSGPGLELEKALKALKKEVIDQIILADTLNELLSGGARELWSGEDKVVQWNRSRSPSGGKPKVLLLMMPAWDNDFPPFGIAHVSACLREAGYDVDVFDFNWNFWRCMRSNFKDCAEYGNVLLWSQRSKYEKECRPFLEEIFQDLRDKIRKNNYTFAGFSLFTTNLQASLDAFEIIRKESPGTKIFCGGPSCTQQWAEKAILNNQIDAAVFGEGELSSVDLLNAWQDSEERAVPGVWLRNRNGNVVKSPSRPLANINQLPAPDFSDFNIYDYDRLRLPLYFSRGCVARCAFCAETQFWVRYRLLSVENVVASVKRAVKEYGIREFRFNDSLMNGSHKHLEKFADEIIKENLRIKFVGYCRLENELTDELLKKLASAGCERIYFGMETGSQRVTDLMRKETKVEHYERIVKGTFAAGIRATVCVMVGFPGETWTDYFKTVATLLKMRAHIDALNLTILGLVPNTIIAKDLQQFGIEQDRVGEWRTADGKNTAFIRYVRFFILRTVWFWFKKVRTSPGNWSLDYHYLLSRRARLLFNRIQNINS